MGKKDGSTRRKGQECCLGEKVYMARRGAAGLSRIKRAFDRFREPIGLDALLRVGLLASMLLLAGCGGEDYRPELNAIKDRLERLEAKMEQMQYADRKIGRLEDQIKEIRKSLEKLQTQRATVKKRVARESYHVVRRGETLSGISNRYGISVEEICRLNGISPRDIIRPGQRLLVRSVKR
ncbi:MAG: LysM peptidoglycan-binding domain-containing protein [Deltaproteobacteria bacterium]|nr:LysM peptidoglycan-binding domain-containing protein [Deltaproteobacteria bacterium]